MGIFRRKINFLRPKMVNGHRLAEEYMREVHGEVWYRVFNHRVTPEPRGIKVLDNLLINGLDN